MDPAEIFLAETAESGVVSVEAGCRGLPAGRMGLEEGSSSAAIYGLTCLG